MHFQRLFHLFCLLNIVCELPVSAGPTEVEWRNSILSEIRNGAPVQDICSDSMIYAKTSTEVDFKDWAFGIVRQYCPELLGPPKEVKQLGGETDKKNQGCDLSWEQMGRILRGEKIFVFGNSCSQRWN